VTVRANAFLHHMVRNIVGSLLLVGTGEKPEDWIGQLLAGRDRTLAGPTAPAQGLVFVGPLYPAQWRLPEEVTL
jgi:tRNA pseudouridine38-40 synthase